MTAAIAFLTILGGPARPDGRTFVWFPLVGALLGLGLGGLWWGAGELWPPLVAAALVVSADLALTGMLHVDGLADSADGLLPPLADRERRLAVMADPATGAFGVAVVAATLLLRVAGLAAVMPEPLVLAGLWCASRTAMAAAALRLPYAREGGLAASFVAGADRRLAVPIAAGGAALAVALCLLGGRGPGLAAMVGLVVGAAAVLLLAVRRIGGFTGDVLGAAAVTGETVGLIVLAARW